MKIGQLTAAIGLVNALSWFDSLSFDYRMLSLESV